MLTNDELEAEFYARPVSLQKEFLRKVSPRGKAPSSYEKAYEQTWTYLMRLTTIEGEFYDEWLMNLSRKQLEMLCSYAKLEDRAEFESNLKKPRRELTEEELDTMGGRPPDDKLSLLAWLSTTQGWAVYKRDGLEVFYEWALVQTNKLIKLKTLKMKGLLREVRQRLGREKGQAHPPKGNQLRAAHDAKDDFFMGAGFTWEQIPPALRHKSQRRFRGDAATFYELQGNCFNNCVDLDIGGTGIEPTYFLYGCPISK